jgi:LysR family hca operon transcriptional activator
VEAARRAAQPSKPSFALSFLTGQEMDWLPEAMNTLKDQLPTIDVAVSSDYSPQLANALMRGKLDLAFMRAETGMSELDYTVIVKVPQPSRRFRYPRQHLSYPGSSEAAMANPASN